LTFQAVGDLLAPVELIDIEINGDEFGTVFENGAFDCPDEADTAEIIIPRVDWNNALQGSPDAVILMTASEAVNPMPALCDTWIRVFVEYQAVTPADQDGDGEIDACVTPQCPADLELPYGTVNVFDLLELLTNWGGNGAGADIAAPNNVVNVADLLELLSQWGGCG